MQIINDMISFLKTLSFVDYVFFFAVLTLMLLIITLIYFIKENTDDEIIFTNNKKEEDKKEIVIETKELDDLKAITEALENAEPSAINLNKYEEEQEEKAIISYEELLNKKNDFAINYSEEENIYEDLTIKKIDLDNLLNKDVIVKPEIKVSVISYEKEEAFLEALKKLQQKLN
ncbi:MAG: hypothetical protein E7163_01530 [Firmicutes bacterium]|nr:hypothetical protein [Bacillota bacterium]